MLKQSEKYQRLHSFRTKPNLSQISALLIFAIESAVFYAATRSLLNEVEKIVLTSIFTISLACLILFTVWTGQIDSTDKITKAYIVNHKHWVQFLKKNGLQQCEAISSCDKCRSKKQLYNAHCRQCQRCIQNQDHHCAFLNTCIGDKNYKHFFLTVILAFVNLFTYIISFSFAIYSLHQSPQFTLTSGQVISSIIGVIVAIGGWIAITLLLSLHIYLNIVNLTTREFINKGKMIKKTGPILIRYQCVCTEEDKPNQAQQQTQNIIPYQSNSTQSLPGSSENTTSRPIQHQNSTQTKNINHSSQNHSLKVHPQNTSLYQQQTGSFSFSRRFGQQDYSALQSLNQRIQNQEVVEPQLKRYDSKSQQKCNGLKRQQKLNGSQQKMMKNQIEFREDILCKQSQVYKDSRRSQIVQKNPKINNSQELNTQNNINSMTQMQSDIEKPMIGRKGLKVRNFIVKNPILSSLLGVDPQKTQNLLNHKKVFNQEENQDPTKLVKSNSVKITNKRPQSPLENDNCINMRRIKTTVKVNQKDIELEVQTNRNQTKSFELKSQNIEPNSKKIFSNQHISDFCAKNSMPQDKKN